MIALETKTGKLIWDHAVMSRDQGSAGAVDGPAPFSLTGGPVVAKGKVIIGTSLGINTGGGNYIVGLDAVTGKEEWRFNTIAKPGEPGGDSWNGAPLNSASAVASGLRAATIPRGTWPISAPATPMTSAR